MQLVGYIGLTLFCFGLCTKFLITGDPYYFSTIHLAVGSALILLFCVKGGLTLIRKKAHSSALSSSLEPIISCFLFFICLAMANYIAYRHDPLYYDSTEEQIHTLAPQTTGLVAQIKQPVVIRAFFLGGRVPFPTQALLNRICNTSDLLSWQIVDPEKQIGLTTKYGINERDTLHFSFANPRSQRQTKIVRVIDEQAIANALLKLTRGEEKVVYALNGHGEADFSEKGEKGYLFLKEAIEGENIALKPPLTGR